MFRFFLKKLFDYIFFDYIFFDYIFFDYIFFDYIFSTMLKCFSTIFFWFVMSPKLHAGHKVNGCFLLFSVSLPYETVSLLHAGTIEEAHRRLEYLEEAFPCLFAPELHTIFRIEKRKLSFRKKTLPEIIKERYKQYSKFSKNQPGNEQQPVRKVDIRQYFHLLFC